MNRLIAALALIVFLFPAIAREGVSSARTTVLIDKDWSFHLGGAQGAEAPGFDDSRWRKLDLPHDWSIEDLPGTSSPSIPTRLVRSMAASLPAAPPGIASRSRFA